MIVIDDQLSEPPILDAVARWYKGAVVSIRELRPGTVIKDEAMPAILRTASQPTFVTINYRDFWHKITASPAYCVVCFKLPKERRYEVPDLLRELLGRPEYRTKRARMGHVISAVDKSIRWYRA